MVYLQLRVDRRGKRVSVAYGISKMEPPARIELATSTFSALCDTKVALSA